MFKCLGCWSAILEIVNHNNENKSYSNSEPKFVFNQQRKKEKQAGQPKEGISIQRGFLRNVWALQIIYKVAWSPGIFFFDNLHF